MTPHVSSYLKTTVLAVLVAVATGIAAGAVLSLLSGLAVVAAGLVAGLAAIAAVAMAVVLSGLLVLYRQLRVAAGREDLFLALTRSRGEAALAAPGSFRAGFLRRLAARRLLGHDWLVGDEVEIRSLDEILATLDGDGCLDGVPFQAEMTRFCGGRGMVFRSVDKVYDYGRTKQMRRLTGSVLVAGLRCNGADHGGCEALCYLIWKTAWLRRPGESAGAVLARPAAGCIAAGELPGTAPDGAPAPRYRCQYSSLHAASTPFRPWSLARDLRPWIAGNISTATLLVGLGTRVFNDVQRRRGGMGFPAVPPPSGGSEAVPEEHLAVGDRVRVRPIAAISRTLNRNSRHKGLWFDRDMTKHCGAEHRVLARVERIIDDANGEMRLMKTPCIMLDGVDYSGEFLNFNAQHDLFFWREAWLERLPEDATTGRQGPGRQA